MWKITKIFIISIYSNIFQKPNTLKEFRLNPQFNPQRIKNPISKIIPPKSPFKSIHKYIKRRTKRSKQTTKSNNSSTRRTRSLSKETANPLTLYFPLRLLFEQQFLSCYLTRFFFFIHLFSLPLRFYSCIAIFCSICTNKRSKHKEWGRRTVSFWMFKVA